MPSGYGWHESLVSLCHSSAAHGVTIMCGIPPKILGADATISSVLKNNEIAIARIRGASDVVSRAAPGESMLPSSDGKVIEVRSAAELKALVAASNVPTQSATYGAKTTRPLVESNAAP